MTSRLLGLARLGRWLLAVTLAGTALLARAQAIEVEVAGVQVSPVADPAQLGPGWRPVALPHNGRRSPPGGAGPSVWYRVEFERPAAAAGGGSWALYLPYLYDGGRFWLNGAPLAAIAQTTDAVHVRWERPHLITLPETQLREGRNVLLLRAVLGDAGAGLRLPRWTIGPSEALLPLHDRRLFWVRTMPQAAVITCLVVGLFVLFVWLRRRSEVLYGLFGLAAVLWSVRTLTFVIEVLPAPWWPWWRVVYHAATGGFIVVLALFAMRFAGLRQRWIGRALGAYWAVGPLAMVASGGRLDSTVGFFWTGGLIPVGLSIVVFTAWAAWRQRSGPAIALAAAVALATTAGIHDYFVAWDGALRAPPFLQAWLTHRIFLLHHGANLLLLVMVAILTLRFVQALDQTEELNRSLEDRIAARERELRAQHAEVARLERERAAAEERQRIMQDLHDGLGSRLFTSLSRIERGAVDAAGVAQLLRECIAEMRLVFEVAAPEDADFEAVLAEFLFRWEPLLAGAGVRLVRGASLAAPLRLAPDSALQLLRIVQEALTNVLKHAGASEVRVALERRDGQLGVVVQDDGRGAAPASGAGRGLANMASRARRLGAAFEFEPGPGGTRVTVRLPLAGHER